MAAKGPVAEWTVREQLILASAVQRSGDQNWVSVSRAVKPLVEDARPPDYFSQKNCALQYSAMLDKAKHPKRKRSSESAPDSGVTVEEQIVHQLTEKRIKELNSSITEARREYQALKKEIEQIESGELDNELPAMWEKVQAELASKESSESKGSRARKSSVATPTGSATDGDHHRRQKTGGTSADKKTSHKSPEKRSSQSAPEPSSNSPAVKEEKVVVVPSPLPESLAGTSPSHSTPGSTPSSLQRSSLKRKNLETLQLVASPSTTGVGGGDIVTHDESPLPYPMTVPKEEQLRETIVASGGRLSRSLVLPLSPDMHVIVQQPNIAAISAGSPLTPPTDPVETTPTGGGVVPEVKEPSQTLPQPSPLPIPLVTMPTVSLPSTQLIQSSPEGSLPGPALVMPPKQEVSPEVVPATARPKTVAEALSSATLLAVPPPAPVAVTGQQLPLPRAPRPALPSATQTLVLSPTSLQRPPLSITSSRPQLVASTPPPSMEPVVPSPPPLSPSKQALVPTSLITHPPSPLSSAPMKVVSSVLSDPRLSSRPANIRPPTVQSTLHQVLTKSKLQATTGQAIAERAKSKPQTTASVDKGNQPMVSQTATTTDKERGNLQAETVPVALDKPQLQQPKTQTALDKGKPSAAKPTTGDEGKSSLQPTTADQGKPPETQSLLNKAKVRPQLTVTDIKSRLLAEVEKKRNLEEEPVSHSRPSVARSWQDSLPQPSVNIVRETKKLPDVGELLRPSGATTAGDGQQQQQKKSEKQPPESEGERETVAEEETRERVEVLVDVLTTEEKEPEKVAETPVCPPSPPHSGPGGEPERQQSEPAPGIAVDEQIQAEVGSSRRSSVSELPSSPLTAGVREEQPEQLEDTLSRRKQAKTATSKKLWPTRSRKRKLDAEEGMSVESTDLDSEEEPSSIAASSAAPSPAPSQGDGDQDSGLSKKQWKKAIMLVWRHAAQHKYANLFLHPVRDDDAPGYRDVIHRPMDLSTIKRNIETGAITTDMEFQRDMLLMFQNAFMYNSSDHDVYDMAEKMRADVMQSIQDYLSTQLQLIVESSTPKVLRSRDKEGRRGDTHDEGLLTPVKKRRTRADD